MGTDIHYFFQKKNSVGDWAKTITLTELKDMQIMKVRFTTLLNRIMDGDK